MCFALIILMIVGSNMAAFGDSYSVFCFVQMATGKNTTEIQYDDYLSSYIEGLLISQGNCEVDFVSETPLISKEILEYTLIEDTGTTGRDNSGRVKLILANDGAMNFESVSGFPVYTKMEISSVHWQLDKENCLRIAEENGSEYAIMISATSEDNTHNIPGNISLNGQKSVTALLKGSVVRIADGKINANIYGIQTVMDGSFIHASNKGWKMILDIQKDKLCVKN